MTIREISSLYDKLYRPLCLYSFKYMNDYETAEDIVQDCFTAFLDRGEVHPEVKNIKAYLYTAVRNRCLDRLKLQGAFLSIDDSFDKEDDDENIEESLFAAEAWKRIEKLPARQRQILLMSKRDGMKYSEIAEKLGLSEQTVKNQISRALKKLKKTSNFNLPMVLFAMFPVI